MSENKHLLITGASGFIGRHLTNELLETGYDITATSRNPEKAREKLDNRIAVKQWDGKSSETLEPLVNNVHAVINLAGENLARGKWSERRKGRILQSRRDAGTAVSEALAAVRYKPQVLLQASAVGYYGFSQTRTFTEKDEAGEGFLAKVSQEWEEVTRRIELLGIRRVLLRTGVVLGNAGALPKMALPIQWFVGAVPGTGRQWVSWIHWQDEVRAIRFLLENKNSEGSYNLTAPAPVQMNELMKTLARVLKRPLWMHAPEWAIRALFGEMGDATVLKGQKVLPQKLLNEGFEFQFPQLEKTLRSIYNKS